MVAMHRQVLVGLVLLVLGAVLFAMLVHAGANVVSGVGLVLALSGVALIGNGAILRRRAGDDARARRSDDGPAWRTSRVAQPPRLSARSVTLQGA